LSVAAAAGAAPAEGLQWPLDASGRRGSAAPGRRIVAAALLGLDPAAAGAAEAESRWRQNYVRHVRRLVELQAAQPAALLSSSRAGLASAWAELPFARAGRDTTLAEAMARPGAALATTTLRGERRETGDAPARWEVPYRGRRLHGDALGRQIDRWQAAGVAEAGHCDALRRLLEHPEWFDLSDRRLVLLGAGSEAGPLPWLARWRAHLVAVDLSRPALWKRIAAQVRAGNATLIAPRAADAPDDIAACGADLLTRAPEIAAWLGTAGGPLDIGHIAYADGERHVRVALAMDAIGTTLAATEAGTTFAFMATPTDLFAVPQALAEAIRQGYEARAPWLRAVQAGLRAGAAALGAQSFVPHIESLLDADDGSRWGIVDAVVLQQGPNYLLAKRLQQWRAWVARAAGHRVSLRVAPSTSTTSVTHNQLLAAGFRGAKAFDVEVFEPATTNALMAALWVHDLRYPAPGAKSAPAHPLAALALGANHGGLWRVPYLPRSVLPLAALLGMVRRG
jgi:hypothetical protein